MRRLLPLVILIMVAACTDSTGADNIASVPDSSSAASLGLGTVTLLGPAESGTSRAPQFSWQPVQGAVSYQLVVRNENGLPSWSWRGTETEVWMGGYGAELPAGLSEPVVTSGSTWSVTAFDRNDLPVAISPSRSVSPEPTTATASTSADSPSTAPTQTTSVPTADMPQDPCQLIAPEEVAPFFGGAIPPPKLVDLEFGKECLIEQGFFGYLSLSVTETSSTTASIGNCNGCVPVEIGDDAVGIEAESGAMLVAIQNGRRWTVEATGLGPVTIDQLVALLEKVLSRA